MSSDKLSSNPITSRPPTYEEAMTHLVGVVQALSQARDIDSIAAIVRKAARQLTGADGATFVLRDNDQCYYADEDAIEPLWKGKRFPMSACISGWVMLNARSTVIEDIYQDERIPAAAYRPTFVKSLAMVPIRRGSPIGAIGNYWATHRLPTEQEVSILQALADTTSVAIENAELYTRLTNQVDTLQTQQTRIQSQNEALQVFARALSHDLREPARALKGLSGMVANEPVSDEGKTYLRLIGEAANRMDMLVETVFQYTVLDDPSRISKTACDMGDILKATQANLSRLIDERGTAITSDALPQIFANQTQMIQVLQNLIANAIRHNQKPVSIHISAERDGAMWRFCVRDNGVGIASEHLTRIFEPFRRLNNIDDFAGLGLSICQKIIAGYEGRLWCESETGKGAAFFFTLPSSQTVPAPAPKTEVVKAVSGLANVLLVDDREADILLTKMTLLKRDGLQCKLFIAKDADAAHEILTQAFPTEDRIDLMLLDINMPRIDGFELLERLRKDETLKGTAVIMCTGSLYEPDKQNAKSLGALGYLVKPPSFDQLGPMIDGIPELEVQVEGEMRRLMRAA